MRWLAVRGSGESPLQRHVGGDALDRFATTKRPAVQRGDLVVFYAAVWKVIFATGEVVADPEYDPARVRWAWRIRTRPLLRLDDLAEAPPVEAAGVLPRSLGRHSHIRLTESQYDAARTAIAEAMDPAALVAVGYDAMADRYAAWQRTVEGSPRMEWLALLEERLGDGRDVLELGSGAGVASTRILAERGRLTGVDVSAEQVHRARARVPDARFLHADVTELELPAASFDAVVAFYVFNHVPRDRLGPLLERIHAWLRPGGFLLATFGAGGAERWVGEWLGVPMFFSSFTAGETEQHLHKVGFELERSEVVTQYEPPHGEASFLWVLARKPSGH